MTEALDHLYDLPFLRRQCASPPVAGQFPHSRALQEALLSTIQQLRPPSDVPLSSPAWRTYNLLHLRYEQGLAQAEVAAKLGIGIRHLQREQQRAVEASATVLQEWLSARPSGTETAKAPDTPDDSPVMTRVEDLIRGGMSLLEPVMQEHNLRADVRLPSHLPGVRANAMMLRQLIISALNWLMTGVKDETLSVSIEAQQDEVAIVLRKPESTARGDGRDNGTAVNWPTSKGRHCSNWRKRRARDLT